MSRRPALALLLLAALPASAQTLTLDQAMAHPDWIGPPVESAWWSLDGTQALYTLKRVDSPIRDTWRQPVTGGAATVVAPEELSRLAAAQPQFDPTRSRAVFVRGGDVFLSERGGEPQPLTRTLDHEEAPRFAADGHHVIWRVGDDWYRWSPATRLATPIAVVKAAKDPKTRKQIDDVRLE